MLIRLFLALMGTSLALLFAGLVLQQLALAELAVLIDALGANAMLLGFALLLLVGVVYTLRSVAGAVLRFCSGREAARRKLLFSQSRQRELQQRRFSEILQLDYVQAMQRARLLRANDRKHVRLLAKSLYRQLAAARANMPRPQYRDLQKAIRTYRRRLDGEALLTLQKQLGAHD